MNELIQQAFERFHRQEWDEAERLLSCAVSRNPESAEPRVHLANLLRIRNRLDEAVPILEPLERQPGVDLEHRWLLFEARRAAGDYQGACQVAERLIGQRDCGADRRREVIDCARRAGDWPLARRLSREHRDKRLTREIRWIVVASRLLRLYPGFLRRIVVRCALGWFEKRNRWRAARALLEAAAAADPRESAWPRRLGRLLRHTRDVYDPDWQGERNCYQAALHVNPDDREAQEGLLQTLFDMGRWSDVLQRIADLERFESEDPFDRLTLLKAACHCNLGNTAQANGIYSRVKAEPRAAFARFCRSLIALEEGRLEDATALLAYRTDQEGLNVLVDFFRRICRHLSAGRSIHQIDGQDLLNEMTGLNVPAEIKDRRTSEKANVLARNAGCSLCGWSGPRVMLWQDRVTGWPRVRCPRCSMISVHPLPHPDTIRRVYTHENRKNLSTIRIYRKALLDVMNADLEACRNLPAFKDVTDWGEDFCWDTFERSIGPEKRYLDVGCSAGRMVEMFRRCGWQAQGIDVDPQAVEFARSRGLNVSLGTIADLQADSSRYHLITLIDVIEHVEDPRFLVERCMQLLAPGGLLYVKTPAADSLPHRFLGDRWLDSPEHLYFFSRQTLRALLESTGLEVISMRQCMEQPTPFLHRELWQEQLYPELLLKWIDRLRAGDVIMFLARKPPGSQGQ